MIDFQKLEHQIRQLPDLAAEAYLIAGCKTVDGVYVKGAAASRPPLNLDLIDCLRADERGLLHQLTSLCLFVADILPSTPEPVLPLSWVSGSGWLLDTMPAWSGNLELATLLHEDIHTIHRQLAKAARRPKPVPLVCTIPGCAERIMLMANNSYAVCAAGHVLDFWPQIKQLATLSTATVGQAAAICHTSKDKIKKWHKRGRLTPAGKNASGAWLYRIEDVKQLLSETA